MSHNLFNERFYSFRQPAWHSLGFVSDIPLSAQDGLARIGMYDLHLESLKTVNGLDVPLRAIVRDPVPDDNQPRIFGTVGLDYHLLTPLDIATIWDENVKSPVETIGALGKGEMMFFTTKLSEMSIAGDEITNYGMLTSPYAGGEAYYFRITPVRTVCENTLVAAKSASTESYRIIHDEDSPKNLAKWLNGITTRSEQRLAAMKQMFELFAAKRVTEAETTQVLAKTYPYPQPVVTDAFAPSEVIEAKVANFKSTVEYQDRAREMVAELFGGAGRGSELKSAEGTGWGLYNAVVEWEDYRRSKNAQTRASDTLFGYRAQVKELAYTAVAEICK